MYYSPIPNRIFSNRNLHTARHWDNRASPGTTSIIRRRQQVLMAVLYTKGHSAGNSMNLSGLPGSGGRFPVNLPVPMLWQEWGSTAKECLHNQQLNYKAWYRPAIH